jgi:hypothetical protein
VTGSRRRLVAQPLLLIAAVLFGWTVVQDLRRIDPHREVESSC